MKKKILGLTLVVTLVVIAAFNINLSKTENNFDFAMANVDALASETTGSRQDCYQTISSSGTKKETVQKYCKADGGCENRTVKEYSSSSTCLE